MLMFRCLLCSTSMDSKGSRVDVRNKPKRAYTRFRGTDEHGEHADRQSSVRQHENCSRPAGGHDSNPAPKGRPREIIAPPTWRKWWRVSR